MVLCEIKVIGCGNSHDLAPCLLLIFEQKRYLFNCPSNFFRFSSESRIKLKKVGNVFFSDTTLESLGGLPGFLCTVADTFSDSIFLHGPSNLLKYLYQLRFYLHRPRFSVNLDCSPKHDLWEDNNVNVWKVVHKKGREKSSQLAEYSNLYVDGQQPVKRRKTSSQKSSSPVASIKIHVDNSPDDEWGDYDEVISYVLQLKDLPGKFDAQKAQKLGVFGKNRALLCQGKPVQVDGITVNPHDVIGEPKKGAAFALVKCLDVKDVEGTVEFSKWKKWMGEDSQVLYVFHIATESVIESPKYQQFLDLWKRGKKFVGHVFLNKNRTTKRFTAFSNSYNLQSTLNTIDSSIFPVFKFLPTNTHQLDNLTSYSLHPKPGIVCNTSKIPEEISVKDNEEAINKYQSCKARFFKSVNQDHSIKLIFLGTGAACPSKYRNVSACLLSIHKEGSILMDCGEGTVYQFFKMYGPEKATEIICSIKVLWISHLHLDHHSGVLEFLQFRKRHENTKVILIAPEPLKKALDEIEYCLQLDLPNIEFVCSKSITISKEGKFPNIVMSTIIPFNLNRFFCVNVFHSKHSYGLVIEHKSGWKVVHSGDCRPSEDLIKFGQNATLLIHEASLDDSKIAMAKKKKHSTISEAVNVGIRMKARHIVLTHFSQRYPKIPTFEKIDKAVVVAFDMMSIDLNLVQVFPMILPILQKILEEEEEEEEEV